MKIISLVSAAVGIPILFDGIALLAKGAGNIGTYLTLALGIALVLIAVFIKLVKKLLFYPICKLLCTALSLLCIVTVISSAFLFTYGKADTATYTEDYLIVLGCGLNGSEPSELLTCRLDKAVEYANRNDTCKIIVTGGMGNGEDIPESEAMYNYLTQCGINPDRILCESRATSTNENFKFSNELTDKDLQTKSVAFITNDFHIYRALSLAKYQGLSVTHLSANTPLHSVLPSYLRENLALIKMFMFNE